MKDTPLKIKAQKIVDGLEEVQNKMIPKNSGEPIGYLSAFPETRFDDLEAGRFAAVPWYMIHKMNLIIELRHIWM